jgi:transcription antitermination factor NusG
MIDNPSLLTPDNHESEHRRQWYAIFTVPNNEKTVAKHLQIRSVESFLPTYEKISVWKNRRRVNLTVPLFPAYLFARIARQERSKVLGTPGVIRIVGSKRDHLPIPDHEIEFLKDFLARKRVEPCMDLVLGDKVRVKRGALQGIEGTLLRTNNGMRFVLSLRLINQHALVEIDPEDIEAIVA